MDPATMALIASTAIQGGQALFGGDKGGYKQKSRLSPEQKQLQEQLLKAGMGSGAGGAFGSAADYYRDLLSDDSKTAEMMFAPEQRRFREQIIPDLSEQFAGMGAGALSSSGFRNAAIGAGTDLSERLGAIRAKLRSEGAAGLTNIGQIGLNPTHENIYEQVGPGASESAGNIAAQGINAWAQNKKSKAGTTSPYGNYEYNQPLSQSYDTEFRQRGI